MVLRYLKGTREYGIIFRNDGSTQMIVDVDADWAGCRDSRKSISGWICRLGGGPISYRSATQSIVARSAYESELTALYMCIGDLLWLRDILEFYGHKQKATEMHIDNSDVIIRCQELKLTKLNRHIGVRQASCVETFTAGVYYPIKVPSSENAADGLTKILKTKARFLHSPEFRYYYFCRVGKLLFLRQRVFTSSANLDSLNYYFSKRMQSSTRVRVLTLILNYGRPGLPKHGGMGGLSVVRRAATLASTMLSTAPADVVTGCGVRVGERLAEHRQSSIG